MRQLGDELLQRWSFMAGALLGNAVVRAVGGQWSALVLDGASHPVVRCHSGRTVFPMLQVLDRLCAGPGCAVDAWLAELQASARAASVDDFDLVSLVPLLCMELLRAPNPSLPLHDQLNVQRLDFSLASLMELDRWLLQLRARRAAIEPEQLNNLVKAAGCYLGEVIRDRDVQSWRWENYADYFDGTPGLPQVSKVLGSAAVLRGHGQLLFPLGQIGSRLRDDDAPSLFGWASKVVGQDADSMTAVAAEPVRPVGQQLHGVESAKAKAGSASTAKSTAPPREPAVSVARPTPSPAARSPRKRLPKAAIVPLWTAAGALIGLVVTAAAGVPWTGGVQVFGFFGLAAGIGMRAHAGRPGAP
jgi:hypothetical protein